ncbi:MAG: hypothetical protein A2831_02460 [Candidatus Yanofskybacteria bacterium RIFCSPHIGHO2_01_FULL_44_17]|uniref:EF-hand domain-containing protein n=1 Tax=Candidatus Yanofskybacteria bacterium RIFCSPHIGHO2_01_FULL_44_17 TaxID=1802668 RepID=A0A1F8EV61_9BACT|nr:MAG: hypothetical protein A2831_02460 [Candidatus Yanofskybacteria bacterium RIFCSPHIGHO2_01_FULL_44_17]
MPTKIKVVLGSLLLIAGFVVVRIGLYFKHSVDVATSVSLPYVLSETDNNPFLEDQDHDGITDYDEAYYRTDPFNPDSDGDGYLDGEEIVSGYNPTKDDIKLANQEPVNITNNLTQRLTAGIYAGDLNPRNGKGKAYDQGINYIALAAIDEALGEINNIPSNNTIQTTDGSAASQEQYLKNVADILEGPFLDTFIQQPQILHQALLLAAGDRFQEANDIFEDYNIKFTGAYTRLLATPAPDNWVGFHKNLLDFFRKIAVEYNYATKWQEDPMLALTSISDLARSLSSIDTSILQELRSLIEKNNLTIPDSKIFEVIGLLNSPQQ